MQTISHSEEETKALAEKLSAEITCPTLICLHGDLGAGKSVFARSFIRKLTSEDEEVPSPTFTLVQTYDSEKGPIHHFDLYRLEDPDEIFELGWEDALSSAIILLEWPDRLGPALPKKRTDVTIKPGQQEHERIIEIEFQAG